jgi:hypothetical protein
VLPLPARSAHAPLPAAARRLTGRRRRPRVRSQWNTLQSNGDMPFEASRLASQIISQAQLGYEAYIFKARDACVYLCLCPSSLARR